MINNNTRWVVGHKITPHDTTGNFDLVMIETPPHVKGPPPHMHKTYSESFLVIEGEMQFFVDGKTKVLKVGEVIDIPPNTLHTFENASDNTCKVVNIHSPKGFRKFFENFGVLEHQKDSKSASLKPAVIQKLIETASDYDMLIPQP